MDLPAWVTLVLTMLAAHRLTMLITADTITEPLRDRAAAGPQWLATLVHCPWCIGFWISAATVGGWALTRHTWTDAWTVCTAILASSSLTGLLAERSPA